MPVFTIKTYNKISEKGLSRFPEDTFQLSSDHPQADAYILRSHKLHGEALPASVVAVARAGAGVNNVPVADYTQSGVVVFNSPGANANAVKELVLAGMLLSSRDILGGKAYADSLTHITCAQTMSKQLEAEKSRFAGNELLGKTLGVIGLGAIGSMVAEMALALGMQVVGYDPALSVEAAWRLPSQVRRAENLNALLAACDYITLHVPALEATHHLINAETLKMVKPTAVLLNFAREAIVDSAAVSAALEAGKLRLYVCDFPEPGMINRTNVIALPHIGASTEEAEENCAIMAAEQLKDFLINGNITNSVNFPAISLPKAAGCFRLTFSNKNVSGVLGNVLSILATHSINVIDMLNKSRGEVAYSILDCETAPSNAALSEIAAVESVIRVRVIAE